MLVLKRNGGDLDVARQVVQDTFVAAYVSFHTFHSKSTYFTWLCRIALNKLADYYRGQVNKNFPLFANLPTQELSPDERMALDELRAKVNACLNLLPPQHRRLLQLKYYQELSTKEICLKLDLSPRSLEGKLYRAKKLLAGIYEKSA